MTTWIVCSITELERRELVELLDDMSAEFGEDMHWKIADRITQAYRILGAHRDV